MAAVVAIPLALLLLWGIAWAGSHWFGTQRSWFYALLAVSVVGGAIGYLWTRLKWTFGTSYLVWQTVHIVGWRLKFYDRNLNDRVQFARHALSIDERRKDFKRVEWSNSVGLAGSNTHAANWFEQIWFSGCHADIGGGYLENESRLSDIALGWIVDEASKVPHPILLDRNYLRPYPSAAGMQHDETQAAIGGIKFLRWAVQAREVPDGAWLHASVFDRLALQEVQDHGSFARYDPEPLRGRKFNRYDPIPAPSIGAAKPKPADAEDDQG
jgi:hypothetical protein